MKFAQNRNNGTACHSVRAEIPADGGHRTGRAAVCNAKAQRAFTLLEVIIACAIFFMAAFAILELVTTGLAQARSLEQREPDAGMLAATLSLTNQLVEGADSGDFEDVAPGLYKEYRWARSITEISSNSLFEVDFIVYRDAKKKGPAETEMKILLFRPGSKPGSASGALGGR